MARPPTPREGAPSSTRLANLYVQRVVIPEWVAAGKKQKQLAELSELAPAAISTVKRGGFGLSMDSVERLAVALGTTLEAFLEQARAWWAAEERQARGARRAGAAR